MSNQKKIFEIISLGIYKWFINVSGRIEKFGEVRVWGVVVV